MDNAQLVSSQPSEITHFDDTSFRETLLSATESIGVSLTDTQVAQCLLYTRLLLQTNAHTNLTRITAPSEIAIKHFVDSLTAVPLLSTALTIADVGTGAGFPGIVLKIARPDLQLTLIDSLQKRLTFLGEVVTALGLMNVTLIHTRAEEAGRSSRLRERFDIVTARAVAALPTLLEWCGPLVKPGGVFIAMKAGGVEDEIASARNAMTVLKLRLTDDRAQTLPPIPGSDEPPAERRLLTFRKTASTPSQFPRSSAEIKRKPL